MELLINEPGYFGEDITAILKEAACECIRGEGLDPEPAEISLSVVSGDEIRQLNRDFRGVDSVTDVLSFPLLEDLEQTPEGPEVLALGDVVICLDRAREQAKEFGHSEEREIVYLFVHSVLHLLGYDHMEPDEKREMRQREEEVMRAVGLTRGE